MIKIGWENNVYFKARGFTTDLQLNKCSWHKNKGIKKINKARDNKERKKERKKKSKGCELFERLNLHLNRQPGCREPPFG